MPTPAGWTSQYETNYEALEADEAEKETDLPSEEARSQIVEYLSKHGQMVVTNRFILKDFEDLTSNAVEEASQDQALLSILKEHGWNGLHYRSPTGATTLNVDSLAAAVSNLFLKTQKNDQKSGSSSAEEATTPSSSAAAPMPTISDDDFDAMQKQVKSFCSNLLIRYLNQLAANGEDLSKGSYKFPGSVMLVDISGFSKFSSSMCSKGVTGLDGLHKATNEFLGHFIDIVYQYRGDVVSFAGDALICVFGEDSTVKTPMSSDFCLRALQCACELRQRRTEQLGTHIAVSTGDLTLGILGGLNDQWTYLLNGPCISKLASCIDDAGPAEVVASHRCFEAAREAAKASGIDLKWELCEKSGNFRIMSVQMADVEHKMSRFEHPDLQTEDEAVETAEVFVPYPALSAIYGRSLESIAELRQVTTMFLKLDSYSPEQHHDPMSLQPFFLVLQEVLATSGGFLRQFLVDDKGCVAIAMWGVPGFSNSNDCSRGLYCAVTMSRRVKDVDHVCSIGLTTGNVYCGNVGKGTRRDFVGIGDKVNLSARLMSKAKGGLFVDQATYDQLPRESKAKLAPFEKELELKGEKVPVRPFCYVSEDAPVLNNIDDDIMQHFDEGVTLRTDVVDTLAAQLDRTCDLNDDSAEPRLLGRQASVLRSIIPEVHRKSSLQANTLARRRSSSAKNEINLSFRMLLTKKDSMDDINVGRGETSQNEVQAGGGTDNNNNNNNNNKGNSKTTTTTTTTTTNNNNNKNWTKNNAGEETPIVPSAAIDSRSFRSGIAKASSLKADQKSSGVNFSVVIGPPGSGKSTIAQFFKIAANRRKLHNVVHVQAFPGDEFIKCEVLARIFWALANPLNNVEDFDQLSVKIKMVKLLVYKAHPELMGDRPQLRAAQQYMLYHLGLLLKAPPPSALPASPSVKANENTMSGKDIPNTSSDGGLLKTPKKSMKVTIAGDNDVEGASAGSGGDGAGRMLSGLFGQSGGSSSPTRDRGGSLSAHRSEKTEGVSGRYKPRVGREVDGPSGRFRPVSRADGGSASPVSSGRPRMHARTPKRGKKDSEYSGYVDDEINLEDERLQTVCYNVFKFLLSKTRTVIIIDDAQHCDEFTLGELSGWLNMKTVHCSVLLTVLSNPDMAQRRANADRRGSGASSNSSKTAKSRSSLRGDETNFADLITSYGIRIGIKSVPIMADSDTVILQLDDLDYDEVRKLLVRSLGEKIVTASLVDRVMAISCGNAFWCKTIADFISEFGVHEIMRAESSDDGDGGAAGTQEDDAKLQRLLNYLAISRLEKLTSEEQLIAKHASVIGQEVRQPVLAAVLPRQLMTDSELLTNSLDSLVERGFLYCVREKPEMIFKFRNDLLRTKIYELLPIGESSKIHLAVATFIEAHYKADLRSHYASLGQHYRMVDEKLGLAFKYTALAASDNITADSISDLNKERRSSQESKEMRERAFKYSLIAASEAIHSGSYQSAIDICHATHKLVEDAIQRNLLLKTVEEGCMVSAAANENPGTGVRKAVSQKSVHAPSPNLYFDAARTAAKKTTNVFYERFEALKKELRAEIARAERVEIGGTGKKQPILLQPLLFDNEEIFGTSPNDEEDVELDAPIQRKTSVKPSPSPNKKSRCVIA